MFTTEMVGGMWRYHYIKCLLNQIFELAAGAGFVFRTIDFVDIELR